MEYDKSLHKYLMELSATALQVSELLLSLKSHLSVAESCTGGLIAATCTSISGASDWFDTGVTTYTRHSKQCMLGLKDREIRDGLVSEATAIAMCEHVAKLSGADIALSTTGVAGPSESEGYKPCAAWIAVHTPMGTVSRWLEHEDEGRNTNRAFIALQALSLLREELQKYQETSVR